MKSKGHFMRVVCHHVVIFAALLPTAFAAAQAPIATTTPVPANSVPHMTLSDVSVEPAGSESNAEHPIKWITSYDEARRIGTRSNRPVMLFVTMDGCYYCDKMRFESFNHTAIAQELADDFVPAVLYLKPDSKLAKSLKITLYPTTMFIAPDGKIISYSRGYVPREQFQSHMQVAKRAVKPENVSDEEVQIATLSTESNAK